MLSCSSQIQNKIIPVLQYTGKFMQRLGQYNQCIQNQQLNYNLITLVQKNSSSLDLGTFMGICLPIECSAQIIRKQINLILQLSHQPLQVGIIKTNIPDYQYDYSWPFYLTIIIGLILIILVLLASLTSLKNKFKSFSILQNTKYFQRNPNSSLNVLNGVRSLSMMWVVIGHVYSMSIAGSSNIITVQPKLLNYPFLFIQAGLFAVDVFFFVGGFLVAYVVLKDKSKSNFKYPIAIIQRFLRFWPSYIFAILIYYSIYLHLGSGPFWGSDQETVRWCQKPLKTLFFVDNLVDNGQSQCLVWGWYLQNDMQIFIFSIIILFIYNKNITAAKIIIQISIISSLIFTYFWTFNQQTYVITHLSDFQKWGTFFTDVYIKPWARCPPYFFGLFLGIIYFQFLQYQKSDQSQTSIKQKKQLKILVILHKLCKQNNLLRISIQWFGILIMLFIVLLPRSLQLDENSWPQQGHSLYQALGKFIFVIALTLTILPSLLGCKKSIINFMMDTNLFNFIAKISFCTYLIHLVIINTWNNSRKIDKYYSLINQFVQYFSLLVISCFFGLLLTLIVQIPFLKLQKQLIHKLKLKIVNKKQIKQQHQVLINKSIQSLNQNKISLC